MINTAILGYGFSAKTFHLPFLSASSAFKVTDIVSSRPEDVKADLPDVQVTADYSQLKTDRLDLVIITTPNSLHFQQAKYFLNSSCHVLVEKPFVLNSEQAKELQQLAKAKNKQLVVFQNRRFDGDFLTLQKLIEQGLLGDIKRFHSRFDRFRPNVRKRWREQKGEGAGILWDLAPHLVDQAVCLFGRPKAVSAVVKNLRLQAEVDDNFEISLEYDNLIVQLGSSSFQAGPVHRFSLQGSEGNFEKYGLDVQEEALRLNVDVKDKAWGEEGSEHWGKIYTEVGEHVVKTEPGNYAAFFQKLAEAITEGSKPPVTLGDSVLVIEILEKAHRSAQEKRVVAL